MTVSAQVEVDADRARRWLCAILLAALAVRLPWFLDPILNVHDLRQTQTAMQARNLVRDNFDLLHPRIDWLGSSPGYMALEFPVYQGIVAVLYRLFGVHEVFAKLVSLVAFGVSTISLYFLASRFAMRKVALWACAWFSFSPLMFFASTAVIPDMLTLALGLGALHLLAVSNDRHSKTLLVAAIAVTLAAFLSKSVMCLPLFFPVGYLLYQRLGSRFLVSPWSIVFGLVVIVPLGVWTGYTERLNAANNFGEHIPSEALQYAIGTWHDRVALDTHARLGQYYGFWILGAVGLPLCVLGAIALWRRIDQHSAFFLWWAIGLVGYFAFYTVTIAHHSYYQLPMIPLISVAAGCGIIDLQRRAQGWPAVWRLSIAAAMTVLYLSWWWMPVAHAVQQDSIAMAAAKSIQAHTQPTDLVLVAAMHKEYAAPADYRSYASILYYADRRGWCLGISTLDDASIAALEAKGATYLALTWGGEMNWLSRRVPALSSLQRVYAGNTDALQLRWSQQFEIVEAGDHHLLFRLKRS